MCKLNQSKNLVGVGFSWGAELPFVLAVIAEIFGFSPNWWVEYLVQGCMSRYELKSQGREFGLESKLRIRIQRFNTGKNL